MEDLTFGEQVKIILGRKGMTIKQLAEQIEEKTGKKMSRQNLTQRLGRDNFQEQDMRMIASILECPFYLSIMNGEAQYRNTVKTERPAAEYAELEKAADAVMPEETVMPEGDAESEAIREFEERKETEVSAESEAAEETEVSAESEAAEETEVSAESEAAEETEVSAESEAAEEAEMNAETNSEPEEYSASEEQAADEEYAAFEGQESSYTAAADVQPSEEPDEVDMTIGELYDIHQELSELEENARAGEPVEAIKEELEKPKKERFSFFRRKRSEPVREKEEVKRKPVFEQSAYEQTSDEPELKDEAPARQTQASEQVQGAGRREEEFEPVISRDDSDEDVTVGDVNPYTGREYQSNSVRMHPTRIGYVQVYDRNIHKWTDMTEWAFLGYQERKKALLGKAYEPPIYLD